MSAPPRFRLEGHERIDASSATALVRLRGTWTADEPVTLGPARLEVAAGDAVHSADALVRPGAGAAAAGPDGTPWSAAFPLPREIAEAATEMTLLVEGAEPAQLPAAAVPRGAAGTGPTRAQLAREAEQAAAALAGARRDAERFQRERDDAQSRLGAAEDRATAVEERLRGHRREDAADDSALRHRVAELEAELEAAAVEARRLEEQLARERARFAEATARLREEAEARDRAEARAAGRPDPGPAPERPPQTAGRPEQAPGGDDLALRAEIQLLEAEAAGARGEADELAAELVQTRRRLEEAVERLRAETEARMRAEARGREA